DTRTNRTHPALKHGAYSSTDVLPGESKADFEKLHRDLIAEWAPSGALEDNIIATMARYLWRKQNIRTLSVAEFAKARYSAIRNQKRNTYLESITDFRPLETEDDKKAAEAEAQQELGTDYVYVELGELATFEGLMKQLEVE